MSNADKIAAALSTLPAGIGICDDCLEVLSDVHPRNQVRQVCARLVQAGVITRRLGDCSARQVGSAHGRAEKLLNALENYARSSSTARPATEERSKSPSIATQTDALSQWLFDAESFLGRIDGGRRAMESFYTRVSRLRGDRLIPASLSNLMQLLYTYRLQVVKNREALNSEEWEMTSRGIRICASEWKK